MRKILNKKVILILLIIFIIVFIKIFFLNRLYGTQGLDDILFLRLLSNGNSKGDSYSIVNNNTEKQKQYNFKISYKNTEFRTIDLSNTIDNDTLVYERIAPGTKGSFNILLDSTQNLKYKIDFYSKNEKPKNLKFKALREGGILGEADTLEELSKELVGYINKNEKINIIVEWYWSYEDNQNKEYSDIQDTKDSENIRTYQFTICTSGEE